MEICNKTSEKAAQNQKRLKAEKYFVFLLSCTWEKSIDNKDCIQFLNSLPIGHFRVLLSLCFKTSVSSKPFLWKWVRHKSFIFMQIKVIFIRMVSKLDSLWNRGARELGNMGVSGRLQQLQRMHRSASKIKYLKLLISRQNRLKNITTWSKLSPPQALRFQSQVGEFEARETGVWERGCDIT